MALQEANPPSTESYHKSINRIWKPGNKRALDHSDLSYHRTEEGEDNPIVRKLHTWNINKELHGFVCYSWVVQLVCTLIIYIIKYFCWRPGGFEQKYWALPWQILGSIMSDSVIEHLSPTDALILNLWRRLPQSPIYYYNGICHMYDLPCKLFHSISNGNTHSLIQLFATLISFQNF